MKTKGREKKAAVARPAKKAAAKSVAAKMPGMKKTPAAKKAPAAQRAPMRAVGMKDLASRRLAVQPQHPMSAEQDRFEDEDGPFDEGVL